MAAKQCEHEFYGHKDGVTCKKCGLKMATEAYLESLKPKQEKPKENKKEG